MTDKYYQPSLDRFLADTEDHEMTVLLDDGLYRHLRVKKPGSSIYWFEVVTWPNVLVINGDMGTFTFSREREMFAWFGRGGINPDYWSQKLQGTSRRDPESGYKQFSPSKFRRAASDDVRDYIDRHDLSADEERALWEAVRSEVLDVAQSCDKRAAIEAAMDFSHHDFGFCEPYEWDMDEYTIHYLWCCHAIRWSIEQYLALAQPAAAAIGDAA